MEIPKGKIEGCTAKASYGVGTRAALAGVYLDVEKKTLSASNGKILAVIPVKVSEDDSSGFITPDQLKRGRKGTTRANPMSTLRANGDIKYSDGSTSPREDLGTFPDLSVVTPNKEDETISIILDAGLLKQLADAVSDTKMGHGVKLHIKNASAPIRVEGTLGNGVIMPMTGMGPGSR